MQMRRGWPLQRKGESIPRGTEQKPWEYEGQEDELAAMTAAGEEDNAK
jgi:hypothetical protein